jgi:hypothetical protein
MPTPLSYSANALDSLEAHLHWSFHLRADIDPFLVHVKMVTWEQGCIRPNQPSFDDTEW